MALRNNDRVTDRANRGRPPEAGDEEGGGVNLLDLAKRYKWPLGCGALAGLLLGVLAYWLAGPDYRATGQVMVSRRNGVPLKEERSVGDFGERSEHIPLILSPMIAGKAVELGKLKDLPTLRGEDDLVEEIIDGLKVKRVAGQDRSYLNVLDISFESPSAADARQVVKAVMEAYAAYLAETRDEKTKEIVSLAQSAQEDLLRKLREKESEYQQFRESVPLQWKAPIGSNAPNGQVNTTNVHQERVIAIEEQRKLNLLRQAELRSRAESLRNSLSAGEAKESLELLVRRFIAADGPNSEMEQQQQEVAAFENRLLPLILEEQKLLKDYGPDHPEVKLARQAIDATLEFYRKHNIRMPDDASVGPDGKLARRARVDLVTMYLMSVDQQLKELGVREQQLTALLGMETTKAKEFARLEAKDQAMTSEIERMRTLWEQVVGRLSQLQIDKDTSGYTLKQLGPIKEELSLKKLIKFFGGGMMAGLGLVAGLCFLREIRDTRIRSVKDVQAIVDEPVLGTVGRFSPEAVPHDPFQRANPALRYLRAPASIEAENYRGIRAALLVILEEAEHPVIQVTSPEPGDGKTTLISNLALSLADSGMSVLLVDADLRRPMVHRLFGLNADVGLINVLQGELDLATATVQTVVERLSIVPAGTPPKNPAELLTGPDMKRVLEAASRQYDVVLVDTPPVLAVSDPCVISRACDGLILTVRAEKNRRPALQKTAELLDAHNAPLVGVVVNGLDPEDGEQLYYYREYSSLQTLEKPREPARLEPV